MKAIVIDDDMATVEAAISGTRWQAFGIDEVLRAYHIRQAKEVFAAHEIAVAVCDIEMPMGSGLDLLHWVRENGYETRFVFLTNHESFEFAQRAMRYEASGYVVKPFSAERLEAELLTATRRHLEGKKRQETAEAAFWSDLFQNRIADAPEIIRGEIAGRKLEIDPEARVRFVLAAAGRRQTIEEIWGAGGAGRYEYALSNVAAEMICGTLSLQRVAVYHAQNASYLIVVLPGELALPETVGRCEALCRFSREKLGNEITCYVSAPHPLSELAGIRAKIEADDRDNVDRRGRVLTLSDLGARRRTDTRDVNQEQIVALLHEKKKGEILNLLKEQLQTRTAGTALTATDLQAVRQQLLQAVYVYLYQRDIVATQLFADPVSAQMEEKAADSVLDMIRWQGYMINQTVDYASEVEKSASVVERMRAFVHRHYAEEVSRTEVAASVFLTPEYAAKVFKKETGKSLKQYLNDYRMEQARRLLSESGALVSDVAEQVGFDNFSYFSTVFKKSTGKTPQEYRTEQGGAP